MTHQEIRQRFVKFFSSQEHAIVPSSSLLPDDPSVLLTTAGMQQFKPYYVGEADPIKDFGSRSTVSIQKAFRTSDVDEVGDDSHLTFFEMLGNFSFGGYQKKEAIKLAYDFLTLELGLPISYVTVFGGGAGVAKDDESREIWHSLGVVDIREEGLQDVFWGPTGSAGPCGPTTEIYCRNRDGRDIEIWNIVFNQFFFSGSREELLSGSSEKKLSPLEALGVDTGMGLERLTMIVQGKSNIFETDLFDPLIGFLPSTISDRDKRVIVDHLRAIVFLISDGIEISNKGAGYVLRRLIRRVLAIFLSLGLEIGLFGQLIARIGEIYKEFYPSLDLSKSLNVFAEENLKYGEALNLGLKKLSKTKDLTPVEVFKLYESYGLPFEVIRDRYPDVSRVDFDKEFARHQDVSRAGGVSKFSGGLIDHEPETIRLHTAHHLLLAALKKVLGESVKQRGSNINHDRLRLDFSFDRKLSEEEKRAVEKLVNIKIEENLPVIKKEMAKAEAEKLGAEMEFGQKYGERVSVYFIGNDDDQNFFSIEFCGGPHVSSTGELVLLGQGKPAFKIIKEEGVARGVRRIKATLTS